MKKKNLLSCFLLLLLCNLIYAQKPMARFDTTIDTVCRTSGPYLIHFFDLSTNNPTSWNWSFPGAFPNSSTEQNPFVHYDSSGTFPVTLIAGNSFGTDTFTVSPKILFGYYNYLFYIGLRNDTLYVYGSTSWITS